MHGKPRLWVWVLLVFAAWLSQRPPAVLAGDNAATTSLKSRIRFMELPAAARSRNYVGRSPEVAFRSRGKPAGRVWVNRERLGLYFVLTSQSGAQTTITLDAGQGLSLESLGVVEIDRQGNDDVFSTARTGGTGAHSDSLNLLNPRLGKTAEMTLFFSHQATEAVPGISRSENMSDPRLALEWEFLEGIKGEYGYRTQEEVEQHPDDPRYAYYFWKKDNGQTTSGPLHLRWYTGNMARQQGSENARLLEGNTEYVAYFKGGVMAFDRARNRSCVLYHPDDMYAWPQALAKHGPLLFIGTRGEGLVVVDVERPSIQRHPNEGNRKDVTRLGIEGADLVVNGMKRIPLAEFRNAR